jgi:hypothetical protein
MRGYKDSTDKKYDDAVRLSTTESNGLMNMSRYGFARRRNYFKVPDIYLRGIVTRLPCNQAN